MRHFLEVLTNRPILGVLTGVVVTALIQSSSATTVMVVGFVNAGLMNLSQAISTIIGANIGTTITADHPPFRKRGPPSPCLGGGLFFFFFPPPPPPSLGGGGAWLGGFFFGGGARGGGGVGPGGTPLPPPPPAPVSPFPPFFGGGGGGVASPPPAGGRRHGGGDRPYHAGPDLF